MLPPPNEGSGFFVRAYAQVLQRRTGDHTVGRKLYGWFLAAGIPGADVTPTVRSARAPAFLGQK